MAKPIRDISIIGRRWFQRTYGNTYNSVDIYVDGRHVVKLPRGYGYGDYYEQRAAEWLNENGYVDLEQYPSGAHEPLWRYCKDHGIEYNRSAIDVPRKSDL